jgi:catechol 2,3-dioxygenase-like lactoylglutathione lyase family enzyme
MRVKALDHLVITVRNPDATIEFYTRALGMERITFGAGRLALAFGDQKINLHRAGAEIEPPTWCQGRRISASSPTRRLQRRSHSSRAAAWPWKKVRCAGRVLGVRSYLSTFVTPMGI